MQNLPKQIQTSAALFLKLGVPDKDIVSFMKITSKNFFQQD